MPRLQHATPKYRLHRPSGQAVVTIQGRDHYLGPWKSKASHIEHDRLVGEWLAAGRPARPAQLHSEMTVVELARYYWRHAKVYYGKDGHPYNGYLFNIKTCLRFLKRHYGHTLVSEFGPLSLKMLQTQMVAAGQARSYVNGNIRRIRGIFQWGVANQYVDVEIYQALTTVAGLRKGHTTAREPKKVKPVPKAVFVATLPHLPRVVRDMVRIQRLTGPRPDELCEMKPGLIDRRRVVWCYTPASHKTEQHEIERKIYIGPKAQKLLQRYLDRDPDSYCFSPADSEEVRHKRQRKQRKTPMTPSQAKRKCKRRPKRTPGDCYTTASYRRAIHRACDAAQVEKWGPNRIRHTTGTIVKAKYGIEAAQAVLGHSKIDTTEIYAEKTFRRARNAMKKIG